MVSRVAEVNVRWVKGTESEPEVAGQDETRRPGLFQPALILLTHGRFVSCHPTGSLHSPPIPSETRFGHVTREKTEPVPVSPTGMESDEWEQPTSGNDSEVRTVERRKNEPDEALSLRTGPTFSLWVTGVHFVSAPLVMVVSCPSVLTPYHSHPRGAAPTGWTKRDTEGTRSRMGDRVSTGSNLRD